jgi:hypothetical protein
VDVWRTHTRKVCGNARGVVGEDVISVLSPYKNIFDGASAARNRGNYFGPLAGAKGSLCQQRTDIESVPIWLNTNHERR